MRPGLLVSRKIDGASQAGIEAAGVAVEWGEPPPVQAGWAGKPITKCRRNRTGPAGISPDGQGR
jgi:hypothetical protein